MRKLTGIIIAALIMGGLTANAQPKPGERPDGKEWHEKMQNEKIAFLTKEIDLTSEEAQAFWPIYNQAQKEQQKAFEEVMTSFKALQDALKEGKSDAEVGKLLDAYVAAGETPNAIQSKYLPKYKKILSNEKVARLYAAEEKFRQMQIHRLKDDGRQGPRPEKGRFEKGQGRPDFDSE